MEIPNWIWRDCAGSLAENIAAIFNSLFREGCIPQVWKRADVVPLPKVTPPEKLCKDLWSISLTSVISKVSEQFIHKWLLDVIKHLLDGGQYGAIKHPVQHLP